MFQTPLASLLGSASAEAVLLHLYHHGETYGRAASGDLGISEYAVRKQLQKLEQAGFLISTEKGRTRVFT